MEWLLEPIAVDFKPGGFSEPVRFLGFLRGLMYEEG
jgi:hypothetical protein